MLSFPHVPAAQRWLGMLGDGRATGHAGLEPARPEILPAGLTHLLHVEAIFSQE